MASNKRVFTLRLSDEVFDKIGALATKQHRSMTNYIEFVLWKKSKKRRERLLLIKLSQMNRAKDHSPER